MAFDSRFDIQLPKQLLEDIINLMTFVAQQLVYYKLCQKQSIRNSFGFLICHKANIPLFTNSFVKHVIQPPIPKAKKKLPQSFEHDEIIELYGPEHPHESIEDVEESCEREKE